MCIGFLTGVVVAEGRSCQAEVNGDRSCAAICVRIYVELRIRNSALDQNLHDRRVEGRVNATSSA